jgi:hypothetical protein
MLVRRKIINNVEYTRFCVYIVGDRLVYSRIVRVYYTQGQVLTYSIHAKISVKFIIQENSVFTFVEIACYWAERLVARQISRRGKLLFFININKKKRKKKRLILKLLTGPFFLSLFFYVGNYIDISRVVIFGMSIYT